MLVTFHTFEKDVSDLQRQMRWMEKLGPCTDHDAVICADAATPFDQVIAASKIAQRIFRTVKVISNGTSVIGWIEGPKSLFLVGARHAAEVGQPFLVMETDAVPLRTGWLDAIAVEYASRGAKYLGHVYDCNHVALPNRLLSGIAVYHHEVIRHEDAIRAGANWDVAITPCIIAESSHTSLIHHLWGEADRPPVFSEKPVYGTEVFCIDQIPKEAVIWHRNKDGSLIHQLSRRLFPHERLCKPITVVFPVCNNDIHLAIHHAKWLRMLHREKWPHAAVVAFDRSVNVGLAAVFQALLRELFQEVQQFCYAIPPVSGWPHAPNFAFQSVAWKMTEQSNPWLWMEADAVVLKADWLQQLQEEYERAGKPWMGPHVNGMSHVNGNMIYPHDAAHRMPKAMTCTGLAWDYVAGEEIVRECHNASHLLQHIWSILGDQAIEVGGGEVPANITIDRAQRWIKKGAVMLHRVKDNSLLNLLMSRQFLP